MIALLVSLALAADRRPDAVCWVSEGRVVALQAWSGPVEDAPIPGHVPKSGAFPDGCPEGTSEGDSYLGRGNYDRPARPEPEPTVDDRVAAHATEIAAVDAKASAVDARQVDALARIVALEAEIAELRAEIAALKAGRATEPR